MTDERNRLASTPAGKRRISRKRPESEVDREGLARVVYDRLAELKLEGITQAEAARRAGCGVSALRNMQNGTGTSHYGHELLTRVAKEGLGLPEDRLVRAFYLLLPRDTEPRSDSEVMMQLVVGLSAVQKNVAGMQEQLNGMADEVHEVNSRLEVLVDINSDPAR